MLAACGNAASTERAEQTEADPEPRSGPQSSRETSSAVEASSLTSSDTVASPDACERALACCPAYLEAVPEAARRDASEACDTLALAARLEGRARDEACQGARIGFQRMLAELDIEPPEACR